MKFDRQTITDKFFIRPGLKRGSAYTYKLALATGLLTGAPTFVQAYALADLATSEQPLPETVGVAINLDKGGVTLEGTTIDELYVAATYTAGFEADGTDDELYDQDQVPEWLQQCALAYACAGLVNTNPDLAGSATGAKRDPKILVSEAQPIIRSKMRYFASALRPLN